ncbi:agglutinin biogenesis protein MshI [Pseudoduganella sp. OTU4001]|uniref:agglutinin biogenesis protein MshI n=1 Tax=Pseudoduganella sp. OTU4001 TaxID=3043854 RepID=UPI00313E010B
MTSFHADGICVARVERQPAAKPIVKLAAFHAASPSLGAEALGRAARDAYAAGYVGATLLAGGEYQLLQVEAPNVPQEELKTAVRWRLKDMLDFHIDDATIDVLDIPVDKNAGNRAHSMFAIAARNSLIQSRQDLFAEAQAPLSVIDIPEMAQRNISALLEPEGRGLAMLSFSDAGGLLTVSYNKELYLARHLEVTLAMVQEQDVERRHASFDKIALELQRSLDHFDRQYHFISISRLMLAPTGVPSLQDFLAAQMYMPVESFGLGDVFDLTDAPSLLDPEEQVRYFLTLGAALRQEEVVL